MKIAIFGDDHLERSLPWETPKYDRYEFRKKLKKKVLEPFDVTFHLGDLTHKKNFIDGKVIQDAMNIFKDKKVYYCLGNHDRSRDGNKYRSLLELLDEVLEDFTVVTDLDSYEYDDVVYILTSYYADEEDIKKLVIEKLETIRPNQKILVLGHWNFYNKLYKSGKNLSYFAKDLYSKGAPIKWILGHEHNPRKFPHGMYLGCLSPNEFGQKQGKVMTITDGRYNFLNYPEGEKFYEMKEEELPNEFKVPQRTYLKIITDDPEKTEELVKKYSNLAHCSVKFDVQSVQEDTREVCMGCKVDGEIVLLRKKEDHLVCPRCGAKEELGIKDETYYFLKACDNLEFEANDLAPIHESIKERVKL